MSDDWLTNDEAFAHVKRLLTQTGAPLESRVARICANTNVWSHTITHVDGLTMSSGRLVYGNTAAETALREVDQGVNVQTFIDVGDEDFFDISLELQVAIECKHRDGLGVFGFPYQSRTIRSATNPILCEFAFADFIKSIDSKVPFLQHHDICTIGLLDAMQKSPRIFDEQLIYKASASLYDFIRFSILPSLSQ